MGSRISRWWRRLKRQPSDLEESSLGESLLATMDALNARFAESDIDFAFIGGVALALHGLPRITRDVDLIVSADAADRADAAMMELGFERLQRGEIFGNYLLGRLRVDLLFTKGAYSRGMLERAKPVSIRRGSGKLVELEDLVGLKLQAWANRPERGQDLADIREMMRTFGQSMDMERVREYFALFERESELDAILDTLSG